MINKTLTKKLKKEFQHRGVDRSDLYIGKSGAGLYYVGKVNKNVLGFPDNVFKTADEAIQAALEGFRPEVIYVVPNNVRGEE